MKSPLRYPGGKSAVAKKLVELIPQDVESYIEPFLGGGSVMLEVLSSRPDIKVVLGSDSYLPLIKFWVTIQNKDMCKELVKEATWIRELDDHYIVEVCKAIKRAGVSTALDFYLVNRCSFSGSTEKGGISPGLTRFTQKQIDSLLKYPGILGGVGTIIAYRDYKQALDYATKYDFLFLDPPYIEISKLYKEDSSSLEFHKTLGQEVSKSNARWMMTINDHPLARELYKDYNIEMLDMTYGMRKSSKKVQELLIRNF
jgi:DNA adenine methylase